MKKIIAGILSKVYHAGLVVTQSSYRLLPFRVHKVPARVISIGNITWGGTGKTPMVAKLARDLSYYGKRVAVLIRGYGMDEVAELQKKLPNVPIIVGRDRVKSAKLAIEKHQSDLLILDDGFQHLRLHRDLDIVAINTTQPFGPGGLLPAGTLREPPEHLARAHVFVLTKSNIGAKNIPWIRKKLAAIRPDAPIFEAMHKPLRFMDHLKGRITTLGEIRGRKLAVISGLGDPYSFERTIETLGSEIVFAARYDDHHAYRISEIADFIKHARALGVSEAVTTEKDFYRLEPVLKKELASELASFTFQVLQMEFQINNEEDFIRRCLNP